MYYIMFIDLLVGFTLRDNVTSGSVHELGGGHLDAGPVLVGEPGHNGKEREEEGKEKRREEEMPPLEASRSSAVDILVLAPVWLVNPGTMKPWRPIPTNLESVLVRELMYNTVNVRRVKGLSL